MKGLSIGLAGMALLIGCHHTSDDDDPYTPARVATVTQNLKYHKVIIHPFAVDKSVDDPATAPADCERSAVDYLGQKKIFASVLETTGPAPDADTLVVDTTVESLRIVGGAARFWGGAFAGSSHMSLLVDTHDASGAAVGQRVVANDNNAMGAAWSFGASDRGLPGDMGLLVADAIIQIAQGTPPTATPSK
jgi:hypothetical protein